MTKYAFYPFKFGYIKIGCNEGKVVYIDRADTINDVDSPNELSDVVFLQLSEYFAGKRKTFDFPIKLNGTPFQIKVWNELCKIPYGEVRTYKDIASSIGNPNACRAVGSANHNNSIIIAVPCHRVINAGGKLGGYGCGVEMKEWLLEIERNKEI